MASLNLKLGPKAIQDISRIQAILNRYARTERASMLQFLTVSQRQVLESVVEQRGQVRAKGRRLAVIGGRGSNAATRPRTKNGTFVPQKKTARRAHAAA